MEILKKQEVNMKESKKTKGKIFISGEKETMRKSPENSPNPASFADLEERIRQIRPPVLEVPSALDQAVLDYARQKQKNRQRLLRMKRLKLWKKQRKKLPKNKILPGTKPYPVVFIFRRGDGPLFCTAAW